jgi:hypothetical protein
MAECNGDAPVLASSPERSRDQYDRQIVEALRNLADRLFASRNFDKRDFWAVREAAVLIEERAREAEQCNAPVGERRLVTPAQHRLIAEALRAVGWADLARHHETVAHMIEHRPWSAKDGLSELHV